MTIHILPARLDTPAAEPLARALLGRMADGTSLLLDGAEVEQVGLACLQALASARATAAARGLSFAVDRPSEALLEGCAIAGLDHLVLTN